MKELLADAFSEAVLVNIVGIKLILFNLQGWNFSSCKWQGNVVKTETIPLGF